MQYIIPVEDNHNLPKNGSVKSRQKFPFCENRLVKSQAFSLLNGVILHTKSLLLQNYTQLWVWHFCSHDAAAPSRMKWQQWGCDVMIVSRTTEEQPKSVSRGSPLTSSTVLRILHVALVWPCYLIGREWTFWLLRQPRHLHFVVLLSSTFLLLKLMPYYLS